MSLQELLTIQSKFAKFETFENELETLRLVKDRPAFFQSSSKQLSLEWINSLDKKVNEESSVAQSIMDSNCFREEGNKLFKADKKTNSMAASRLYTEAIFAAPPGSECLALAHANRAAALQEFGYFKQAYDDCECALEQGYPVDNIQKIIIRQAYCAVQLQDVIRLKYHLDALDEINLNENFTRQKTEFRQLLDEMKIDPLIQKIDFTQPDLFQRDTQKILNSPSKGRYMVAATNIKENSEIFSERASSFVPVGDLLICQNCGTTQLIPFPCYQCGGGKVVYCSLKCREMHSRVHAIECIGYKKNLFDNIGISHLAFRMILDGITQILPLVGDKREANDIWTEINNVIAERTDMQYSESLRMISHLNEMTSSDIIWFALVSELLVVYLKEFTQFFNIFDDTAADRLQWELVVSALILKHIGQLIANAHTCISLVMVRSGNQMPFHFQMLEDVWDRPQHVSRGRLHMFSDYEEIAAANFPYLSLCNHSCVQSFQPKFSGNCVTAFATKDISAGEEIFNCYTLDYRKSKRDTRRKDLRSSYKFECMCEKCCATDPDDAYHQYHRYQCENEKCRQIFTPVLDHLITLNWWDSVDGNPPKKYICCTVCGSEQKCEWFHDFNNTLKDTHSLEGRLKLFKMFNDLSNWLHGYHEIKMTLALNLVMECFAAYRDGASFCDSDFEEVVKILQYYLRGIADQCRVNSIEYVVKMTFLWDFIALGKYTCIHGELQEMLGAIEILSDDMKVIFLNYYEDYIAVKNV